MNSLQARRPRFGRRRNRAPETTRLAPAPSASQSAPVAPGIPTAAPAFATLGLTPRLVRAVAEAGYSAPTVVQQKVIPEVLTGRDVLVRSQTGTGKTATFMLPLLHLLRSDRRSASGLRVLVLAPTRELARQIGERTAGYARYLGVRSVVVHGGVSPRPQAAALRDHRTDVLIATPGRLLDLMRQGCVDLRRIEHLVLDEADRMLDMGFIHDVRKIVASLPPRQTLLFSATLTPDIDRLASALLTDPVRVSIDRTIKVADSVRESVTFVPHTQKSRVLEEMLRDTEVVRAIVFTRTKRGASRLSEHLERQGFRSDAIHGNKSQRARDEALGSFRAGRTRVLVATDVAARGLDVEGISHVINYDMPTDAEAYVHRVGRTGRAGAAGRAISLCDRGERSLLVSIERLIRRRIEVSDAGDAPSTSGGPTRRNACSPEKKGPKAPPHRTRGASAPRQSP